MNFDIDEVRAAIHDGMPPFEIRKIGHVVLMVSDLKRSVAFIPVFWASKYQISSRRM